MRLSQLVADLQSQLELFGVIRWCGCDTRIRLDLEALRVSLAFHCELYLVGSRRHLWTTSFTGPKDHSRKPHCVRISRVPNKTIEPDIDGHSRRSTATKTTTLSGRRCGSWSSSFRTLHFRRKLPD